MVGETRVLGSDGIYHMPRESDGEHHLTVCGVYVRGAVLFPVNCRGRSQCNGCLQRLNGSGIHGGDDYDFRQKGKKKLGSMLRECQRSPSLLMTGARTIRTHCRHNGKTLV